MVEKSSTFEISKWSLQNIVGTQRVKRTTNFTSPASK